MMDYLLSEIYRLEIHWDSVVNKSGLLVFSNPRFSGPAVKEISYIADSDYIYLDFTKQYSILVPNYYVAKFIWCGIERKDNIIYLKEAYLVHNYVDKIPHIKDDDYFVIDCSNHTEDKHMFSANYTAILINSFGERYSFNA